MVVIGIDFGNESCVVTSVRNNRVEAVANDYYDRKTPSLVAFTDKKREIGMAAKNQQSTNLINTIYDFKKFLGTHFYKTPRFVFNEIYIFSDTFFYRLNYLNEEKFHSSLEATEMLLSKLKKDANVALESTPITGCVIAYPSYFSPLGKKQLLLAAGVAGLNCHYMIKETTAVAIDYGFYKKFQRRKNVVFIDFGANSIQISACAFTEKKLEVLTEVSGLVGGRDVDELLTEHVIKKLNSSELNAVNKKFCFKLINEVEKAKKKMSIDTVRMSLNLAPFITDECDSLSLDREEMDEVCRKLYDTIEYLMEQCLAESKLAVYDIDSVEIVGGSTRIPAIKDRIRKVFKKAPSTTMNQDEAVARGCLLRFIMATKRRDFEIVEKELPGIETDQPHFIRIGELHSNYRGDKNDFLYTDQFHLDLFMKFEQKLLMNDKKEEERCIARNKYEELGKTLRKPGALDSLGEIERNRVLQALSKTNNWQTGTTEQYLDQCTKLSNFVEQEMKKLETRKKINESSFVIEKKEEERCIARNKYEELGKTLRKPGALDSLGEIERNQILKVLSKSNDWQTGTTEQYLDTCVKLSKFVEQEMKKVETRKKMNESSFVIVHTKVDQTKEQSTMTYKSGSHRYETRGQKKEPESSRNYQSCANTVKESKFSDNSGSNVEATSDSNNRDIPSTSSKYFNDYGSNKEIASSTVSDEYGNGKDVISVESKEEEESCGAYTKITANESKEEVSSVETNKITSDESSKEIGSSEKSSKNNQNNSAEKMDVDQEQSSSYTLHAKEKEEISTSVGWNGSPLPKNSFLTVMPFEGKVNKPIYRFFEDWYYQSGEFLTLLRDNEMHVELRATIFMTRKAVFDTAQLLMNRIISESDKCQLQDRLDLSMKDLSHEAALKNFDNLERYLINIKRKYKYRK